MELFSPLDAEEQYGPTGILPEAIVRDRKANILGGQRVVAGREAIAQRRKELL